MTQGNLVPPPWDEFHPLYSQHMSDKPPLPLSIQRRRARARRVWIVLAILFALAGGALGFWGLPHLAVAWLGGHG